MAVSTATAMSTAVLIRSLLRACAWPHVPGSGRGSESAVSIAEGGGRAPGWPVPYEPSGGGPKAGTSPRPPV